MPEQGINTYGDIGNATAGYYSRKLLSHAMPVIILERYGMIKPMPRNNTQVIQFRRSRPFQPATTPLQEGIAPDGSHFGYDTLTVKVNQYGDWTGLTDVVQDTSKDMVLRDMSQRQGEQIGETREALTWDVIRAGTAVTRAGSATSRANVGSAYSVDLQRRVMATMHRQKAKKHTRVLAGTSGYETYKIEPSYIVVGHTDLLPDLRSLQGTNEYNSFVPPSKYGSGSRVAHPYESGSFEEGRFILSPDLAFFPGTGSGTTTGFRASNSKIDVYPMLVLGRESFGCIALRGRYAVKPMVLNPGMPRSGDPLGQKGSIGWKFWFACLILNDAWIHRIEVASKL